MAGKKTAKKKTAAKPAASSQSQLPSEPPAKKATAKKATAKKATAKKTTAKKAGKKASSKKAANVRAQIGLDAINIEGGLLSPSWLSRIAQASAPHQSELDYAVPKGLTLRDEIGRYWRIAQAHWAEFEQGRASPAAATPPVAGAMPGLFDRIPDEAALVRRFVLGLLRECFGFASICEVEPLELDERSYPIGHSALEGRVPIVLAPAGLGLDTPDLAFGEDKRRRSPFGLLQEYLNADEAALWGLVCDGLTLRVVRDNASLTRPAWIEVDLARIFAENRHAEFAALWLLLHASRFGRPEQPVTECALEAWRNAGVEEGTRARDFLRMGVEDALLALGQGFLAHPANRELRSALAAGSLTKADYFNQLLRVVYRVIFLLTIEERGLLHAPGSDEQAQALYAEGYGLRRLRDRAVRRNAHDRFSDVWESVKIVFRSLAKGEPRLALPALAGLFAAKQCPDLDTAKLENHVFLAAMYRLSWIRQDGALARVNWRDMGPEELGSVYESLLELVPRISKDGREFGWAHADESKGNARKTSGSYYTPESLVQVLLDNALEPVIADTIARNPERTVEALLELSIVDPACGSGHFLLGAARRLAGHVARHQVSGTPSPADYRHAVRQVVGRCIYGVDLNPMAVELCKVSLWMEAVDPGLPLSFLDSHIQQGNALLGTMPGMLANGIPDAAWNAIEGDNPNIAAALKRRNRAASANQVTLETLWSTGREVEYQKITMTIQEFEKASDATYLALESKEQKWRQILTSPEYTEQHFAADLWCAAFAWIKTERMSDAAPTTDVLHRATAGEPLRSELISEIRRLASEYSFFHWHIRFPHIFEHGGFDVVLGNPPWDTLSPDSKEFFSEHDSSIRFQSKKEQEATISNLLSDPGISAQWLGYRRKIFVTTLFIKMSGRFTLFAPGHLGKGDFNLFRFFVELGLSLSRHDGHVAQVVPDSLYSGANSMALRKQLFSNFRLSSIYGFENAKEHWFPGVDSRTKFCTYTAKRGSSTDALDVAFGLRTDEDLLRARQGETSLRLQVSMIEDFSPEALSIMEFRSQTDIEIARKMHGRFPPLGRLIERTSHRLYLRELESGHSQMHLSENTSLLPHYEGRMVSQYDHRAKGYRSGRARSAVWIDLPFESPGKSIQPQWYVDPANVPVQAKLRIGAYRVGFCDVASPTNERTLVAAMLPKNCIAGDKVPTVMMGSSEISIHILVWLASANSFLMDYLARMKVSLKMALTILDSLPFPRLPETDPSAMFIAARALLLTCTGPEMNDLWDHFSNAGIVHARSSPAEIPGSLNADQRRIAVSEIEAKLAHVYLLTADDVVHILNTFPIVKSNEESSLGEYRTKRLILEIYDEMAEAIRTGKPYQTRLDPPPADPSLTHPPREPAKPPTKGKR